MNSEPVVDPLASVKLSLMAIDQLGPLGVSGAKVVAGDEAIDDGRPGKVIGKSEMSKTGTTAGPLGTTYLSTGGGALVNVDGALLSTAFGLVDGGTST